MKCLISCPGSLRRRNPKWRPVRSDRHYGFQTIKDRGNGFTSVWFLNLFSVHPLYPCVLPSIPLRFSFVPFISFFCTLVCSFLYPSMLFFELFCTNFFTFSFPVVFFPPCCAPCVPITPLSFLSHFFPSQSYFFPYCRTFIPRFCRTFFPSQPTVFSQRFSSFQSIYTEFNDINKKSFIRK